MLFILQDSSESHVINDQDKLEKKTDNCRPRVFESEQEALDWAQSSGIKTSLIPTPFEAEIYKNNLGGFTRVSENGSQLATLEEYRSASRHKGSVFEVLCPGIVVVLAEGKFELDQNLNPIQ